MTQFGPPPFPGPVIEANPAVLDSRRGNRGNRRFTPALRFHRLTPLFDPVVALGAREKETGNSLKVPYVHVWRMENGKAKRVQLLTDTPA